MQYISTHLFGKDKTMTRLTSRAQPITRPDIRCTRFAISKLLRLCTKMISSSPLSCGRPRYRRIKGGNSSNTLTVDRNVEPIKNANSMKIDENADLILKVCVLGDCQTGKSSFVNTYVGMKKENEKKESQCEGANLMDKTLQVRGARISFCIWDVEGDRFDKYVPKACKDAQAIFFMFDLTSRSTLNNIFYWYQRAKKLNPMALPILIGTKFDEFAQLPLEMQKFIIIQARVFAKLMNATLFFSSAEHNINVSKVFKFVAAKVFNLPSNVERNLTIGEPIIDF